MQEDDTLPFRDVQLRVPAPVDEGLTVEELYLEMVAEEAAGARQQASVPARPPLGLSMSHSLPTRGEYDFVEWGKGSYYCAVRRKEREKKEKTEKKPRGPVTQFSPSAARRMRKTFLAIDRERVAEDGILVTLTYHDTWPDTWQGLARDIRAFRRWFERCYPDAWVIGVKEEQARGALHLHFVVFGVDYLPHQDVAAAWNAIVAPGDVEHLHAGTRVERVRKGRQIAGYFAKYAGRTQGKSDGHHWGNRWFIWGREKMHRTIVQAGVARADAVAVKRMFRAWWHAKWRDCAHRAVLKRIGYAPMLATEFERYLRWLLSVPSPVSSGGPPSGPPRSPPLLGKGENALA